LGFLRIHQIFEEMNCFTPIPAFFEDLDFQEKKFDLVILSQVLEHIENPENFLLKIKGILKPTGVLAIALPNINSILVKILKDKDNGCLWVPEHLTYFSKIGINALLSVTGFIIHKHIYVSRIPYNILSNKLNLSGTIRSIVNHGVKIMQWLPMQMCNLTGTGFMHNVWAKTTSTSLS